MKGIKDLLRMKDDDDEDEDEDEKIEIDERGRSIEE